MTDSDLQTVRDWCRANGVTIVHKPLDKYPWKAIHNLNFLSDFSEDSEWEIYQDIWEQLQPWLQSVRNLDALDVEVTRFREAVQGYAKSGHHARCAVPQIGDLVRGVECTCGYEKLKKILENTSL